MLSLMAYAEDTYCFWKMKCEKMLENTQSREDTPQSWSGEYTSILYQEGQLTRLNPISGEDSRHTSILCQERTVNTPQSSSGENSEHTSILVRRGHTSILCGHGRETSRSLIIMPHRASKTPSLQGSTLKVR